MAMAKKTSIEFETLFFYGFPLLLLILLFSSAAAAAAAINFVTQSQATPTTSATWRSGFEPKIVKSLPGYPGDLPFKLETGYIGVGKNESVQSFYYFVESERDPKRDPLIIWLSGGPGCTSLSGLILEIGPLLFIPAVVHSTSDMPQFHLNPYSWTKVASIIFLDSPVGTGFSYATTSEAKHSSDKLQSIYVNDFMRKWLMYHPKFIRNPFYVGGDSYGGKIVPIVVQEILNGNEIELWPKINLKGYIVGNPVTTEDGPVRMSRVKFGHRVSILSDELYESARIICSDDDFINADANNTACLNALQAIADVSGPGDQFNLDNVLEHQCPDVQISKTWCRKQTEVLMNVWTNHKRVQEALQVREGTIHDNHWLKCNRSIPYTLDVQSSFNYHQNLSKNSIRALIYSGDQDMFIPYVGTQEWIRRLDIAIDVNWRPWFVDGQVAGYATDYSNGHYHLTFTTIKGAGHIAVEYKFGECFAMIHKWLEFNYL